jgi:hypothetical protein
MRRRRMRREEEEEEKGGGEGGGGVDGVVVMEEESLPCTLYTSSDSSQAHREGGPRTQRTHQGTHREHQHVSRQTEI